MLLYSSWEYSGIKKICALYVGNVGNPFPTNYFPIQFYIKGFNEGFEKGAKSKNPVIAVALVIGPLLGAVGMWVYNKRKQKKELAAISEAADNEEIKKVEAKLVSEMKAAKEAESGEMVEEHIAFELQEDEDLKEEK